MTRWKASGIHFAISFVVLAVIIGFVVWRWYPPALFGMAKAGVLLTILTGVDVVLGPLLTLIIYRHGKKGLKFDLIAIAVLQVAALAFGLHTIWQSRPAYIVATTDRFYMVFANEIDPASAAEAQPEFQHAPWFGAKLVAAPLPEDSKARLAAMLEAISGVETHRQPARYRTYPGPNHDPAPAAIPLQQALALASPGSRAALQEAANGHIGDLALSPLLSSRGSAGALLERKTDRIVAFVGIDPWPIIGAAQAKRANTTPN